MTDMQTTQDLDQSLIESALGGNAAALAVMRQKRTRIVRIVKAAADAMASTTQADTVLPAEMFPYAGVITAVWIIPTAALTGHATTNATLTVSKYDAAGANKTTVATMTTTLVSPAQSWVAFAPIAMTLTTTAADLAVVAQGSCSLAIAKGSTGVVVPICQIILLVRDT
jgi:dipeptidase